jgi:prepilin-type N-terminal cleavage/methylation domain-containing protein
MKITRRTNTARAGFTLIEMIGVLAVIAILAALLIPKIFEAISSARVSNAAVNCQTVKTAIADHYAKFGALTATETNISGTITPTTITVPNLEYDRILLLEGFLDKPFEAKIGTPRDASATGTTVILAAIGGTDTPDFLLDGENAITGSHVVYAQIAGVAGTDAFELDQRIDGPGLAAAAVGVEDDLGRVIYTEEEDDGTGLGTFLVQVYLTHR